MVKVSDETLRIRLAEFESTAASGDEARLRRRLADAGGVQQAGGPDKRLRGGRAGRGGGRGRHHVFAPSRVRAQPAEGPAGAAADGGGGDDAERGAG